MGGPGTPGGAPGPVGGGVGGPMPKSSSITADVADPNQFGGKVLKKKNRDRLQAEQQKIFRQQETQGVMGQKDAQGQTRDEKGRIMFTSAERGLIPKLLQAQQEGLLEEPIYPQFRVQAAGTEYSLDFGIPDLKIGIEADGEVFHGAPKQVQKDQARDQNLKQQGWTILRFTDTEIERQGPQIVRTIIQEIMRKRMWLENNAKDLKSKESQFKDHQSQ
jgi:very-short-patch-repair endonuclease